MKKRFCDICGKEIKTNEKYSSYKLKRFDSSWWEVYWDKLDVHDKCWEELCKQVAKKVK